MKNLLLKWKYL